MRLNGPFEPGKPITGEIQRTHVDEEIAKHQAPFEGKKVQLWVERIVPQSLFSFRWHPYAIEEGVDYSSEPTTLIQFSLEDAPEGVLLTITESGFDQIPAERRAEAFKANEGGWTVQMGLIAKYLALAEA